MKVDITLKNYRCFSQEFPARFSLHDGFTSFIGVNNSGKSSLLKFFYEFRNLFENMSSSGNINTLLQNRPISGFHPKVQDIEEVFCDANNQDIEIEIAFDKSGDNRLRNDIPILDKVIFKYGRTSRSWTGQIFLDRQEIVRQSTRFDGNTFVNDQNIPIADFGPLFECCVTFSRMLYIGPFRNAINVGEHGEYFDIQIGQAFIRAWRTYKTGNIKKSNEAAIKLTEDIRRIFEFDTLEINPSENATDLKVFVNGKSYRLSELGGGVAQFIIVLANAATRQPQPSFILIDEPELNLHPRLQLDFLTSLASYTSEGIVYATHSIGLARASADWLYAIRKGPGERREITPFAGIASLSEFLGELGFAGYRELGFDKLLLVEGPSDIKPVQHFLNLLGKEHEVVILSLGGASTINKSSEDQLTELTRITSKIHVLIDSERTTAGEKLEVGREDFVAICQRLNIDCHVLVGLPQVA